MMSRPITSACDGGAQVPPFFLLRPGTRLPAVKNGIKKREGFRPRARIRGMHSIKLFRPAGLALLVCLILPFSLVQAAQDKPAEQPVRPKAGGPETISIDFPGGPLSKLVAMLAAKEGATLSIIQSEGLDPILPAFSVREVRTDAVMSALGRIIEPQGFALGPVGPNLAVLSRHPRLTAEEKAVMEKARAPAFVSLQLESKIGPRSVEDVIAAIQQGCEFASADGKPSTLRFKYHAGTKLLFVAGAPHEIAIADSVYQSLPGHIPVAH
jgi:hypothetical protein